MTIMDNPTWTLTDRLKKARMLAGLDQAELAAELRISRNSISNYETGRSEPTASTFVLWAEACGVTLEWLAAGVVRPKGFEPLAFCSVVSLLFALANMGPRVSIRDVASDAMSPAVSSRNVPVIDADVCSQSTIQPRT